MMHINFKSAVGQIITASIVKCICLRRQGYDNVMWLIDWSLSVFGCSIKGVL